MSTPDPTNYYTTEAPPVNHRRRGSRLRHFGLVRKPSNSKRFRRGRYSHKGRGL